MIFDRQSLATPISRLADMKRTDLKFCGRLHSDIACHRQMNTAIRLVNLLSLHQRLSPAQIEGGILGSVVPALTGQVLAGLRMLCPVPAS